MELADFEVDTSFAAMAFVKALETAGALGAVVLTIDDYRVVRSCEPAGTLNTYIWHVSVSRQPGLKVDADKAIGFARFHVPSVDNWKCEMGKGGVVHYWETK